MVVVDGRTGFRPHETSWSTDLGHAGQRERTGRGICRPPGVASGLQKRPVEVREGEAGRVGGLGGRMTGRSGRSYSSVEGRGWSTRKFIHSPSNHPRNRRPTGLRPVGLCLWRLLDLAATRTAGPRLDATASRSKWPKKWRLEAGRRGRRRGHRPATRLVRPPPDNPSPCPRRKWDLIFTLAGAATGFQCPPAYTKKSPSG